MKSYHIQCLSEAVSPITHASGTAGNESLIARERVYTAAGPVTVPHLSGNAIRHRFVREPGAMWLIERLGLHGKLDDMHLNFLLHGGNLTQSTAHENTKRIAECHRLWPFVRVLGGSLPDQILSGKLQVLRGTLICEENRQSLSHYLPLPDRRLAAAEQFATGYQYTRGDAAKTGLAKSGGEAPTNLMIYSGQAVARGAVFAHGFDLQHATEIELGCLLWSLQLWQQQGGTIGGQARLGHGRLRLSIVGDIDQQSAVLAYHDHIATHGAQAAQWLLDTFASIATKKAPKKKQKGLIADELASDGGA